MLNRQGQQVIDPVENVAKLCVKLFEELVYHWNKGNDLGYRKAIGGVEEWSEVPSVGKVGEEGGEGAWNSYQKHIFRKFR